MEYAYLIIFVIVTIFVVFIFSYTFRGIKKQSLTTSKMNLAKRFLTLCYNAIPMITLSSTHQHPHKPYDKHKSFIESIDDLLIELIKLLQKLFEARVVVVFKSSKGNFSYHSSTDPFFPFMTGISKFIDLISRMKISDLLDESIIDSLSRSKNKHRFAIPSNISVFKSKEILKVLKEINADFAVFIPIYKENDITYLIIVLTNEFRVYDELKVIVNLLIDFISIFLIYVHSRQTLNDILSKCTMSGSIEGLGILSFEMVFDTKTWQVLERSCDEKTFNRVYNLIDIETLKKSVARGDRVVNMHSTFEREGGGTSFLNVIAELISENKLRVKASEFEQTSIQILDDVLIRISEMIEFPIVIFDKYNKKILKLNRKFREIFQGYEEHDNIETLMSSLKYISEGKVIQSGVVFTPKNVSVDETRLGGLLFYPLQMVDQRVAMNLYDEAMKIRKLVSSMNLYESQSNYKNIEFYARYQPSDRIIEVGGDFFVVREAGKKSFIGVFDISGHSLSSGFLAVNVKSFVERSLSESKSITKTAEELNNFIFSLNENEPDAFSYITGVLCEVDVERMEFKFISAGHKYGVTLKDDGIITFQDITHPSKPLGIKKDQKFEPTTITISDNDKFFLYTDGIVELEDKKGHNVDEAKVIDLIVFCRSLSIKETIDEIFSYIRGLRELNVKDDFVILGFKAKA